MKKLLMTTAILTLLVLPLSQAVAADRITCWFPPAWGSKSQQAQQIAAALSHETGFDIQARIAKNYPEILAAFATRDENLVYVGSFVQSIIKARQLGKQLVQVDNGKELYSGILIYPEGQDPQKILRDFPAEIAYAIGASSGESTAKAATGGKAAIGSANHGAACAAVNAGKARAAVVKNWWWEANKSRFAGLTAYDIPRFSKQGNPDNVLTASTSVAIEKQKLITAAAMKNPQIFGGEKVHLFEENSLQFSLWLMQQGNIDPLTYSW